ncbi:FK506-binding protein [Biomphalaria pfeifferi]|uniref:peptidylprolyl isomerase n=1 Tax=Biomphalaria pfeifferi TaxID=112525 RepID=A0AAD8FKD3_BIOPF|nr:FK506-binding protein [Biomphalaria pfeifferi]
MNSPPRSTLIAKLLIILIIYNYANCDNVNTQSESQTSEQKEMLNKLKKKQLVTRIMSKPDDCTVLSDVGDELLVHYTGYLEDGTIFDSSEKLNKNPISFKIGDRMVIAGWEKGMTGMCVNEKRRLVIPPELGYGKTGFPPVIPPDATLMFEVTLVDLKKKSFSGLLSDPLEHMYMLRLLAAPVVVLYVLYYLYKRYLAEAQEAKDLKRGRRGSKKKQ